MVPNKTKTPPTKNKTAALVAASRTLLSAFPYRECFGVLLLNSRGRLIDAELVHVGTLDQSLVHPCEVFGPAILKPAAAIVVFHNHPSGDAEPSRLDEILTRRLWAAGQHPGHSSVRPSGHHGRRLHEHAGPAHDRATRRR
jgi:DNA repair protein RadC